MTTRPNVPSLIFTPTPPLSSLPLPTVPVWVGGSSDAARRRAATSADGWVPLFLAPAELA